MSRRQFAARAAVGALGTMLASCTRSPESHPPIGRFVEVEGLRMHVAEEGEGVPVVLIHGASGNLRDFTFSLSGRLAAEGFRAIAIDRPGFGYSARPQQGGSDPAVQARLMRGAAASVGAHQPIIVGHSYGGAVSMAWAVDAPQQVRGVVSLAGATYPWGGDAGLVYRLGASPVLGGAVRGLASLLVDVDDPDAVLSRVFRPQPPPPGYGSYIGVGLALRSATFRANARDLDALNDLLEVQAPRYRGLPVPLEAIHGEADHTVWAEVHSKPLAEHVAEGTLTLLPGIGHMPHHAAPDAVVAALHRIVARTA